MYVSIMGINTVHLMRRGIICIVCKLCVYTVYVCTQCVCACVCVCVCVCVALVISSFGGISSFLQGYYQKEAYIAAQGPLQSTVGDFWQMIWDHNIQVVVMLGQATGDDDDVSSTLKCPEVY